MNFHRPSNTLRSQSCIIVKMDKTYLISMFITFATSNDVLKYRPHDSPGVGLHDNEQAPKFCNGLDCPKFTVVKSTKDYEERIYEQSNWVSTNLTGVDFDDDAPSKMFMKLFQYISGKNAKREKIAMTCPVTTRIIPAQGPACESDFIMSFFISPKVTQAPEPTNKDVFLSSKSELHVYVRHFGGFTPKFKNWADEALKLGKALDNAGLQYETSYYYTAGYDSPFRIFNRHNEVWFIKK